MELLEISVAAGDPGPVVTLAGEADLTSVDQLSSVLTAQLAAGARHLAVDLSGLRFADSAVIRALVLTGRTLAARGGGLELVRPQSAVARTISLLGVDQVFTVRGEAGSETAPEGT